MSRRVEAWELLTVATNWGPMAAGSYADILRSDDAIDAAEAKRQALEAVEETRTGAKAREVEEAAARYREWLDAQDAMPKGG